MASGGLSSVTSSYDVELNGMAEVGYYGIGPLSDVVQWYGVIKSLHTSKKVLSMVFTTNLESTSLGRFQFF